jgi:sigma-B regulation protein RsbU (phosphoserine phosphatase)
VKDLAECRILIVDDVKANVDVLVAALKGEYRLSVALDGATALKSIAANAPDLVLLDIVMPGLDGYEVCRRLRAAPATQELPMMFLSSLEDARNKAQGFEAGANDYLTKPFEALEVKARVKALVKAKAYADAVKEAAARELRVAHEIQTAILPADVPALTERSGVEIAAVLEPAREVGGDLYDVVRASEDRVVFALGDVSGKGVAAALLMAVATTLLRSAARQHAEPDLLLEHVNADLVAYSRRGLFVTLLCGMYDVRSRTLRGANAGHLSGILVRPGREPTYVLPSTGTMVGVFETLGVAAHEVPLEPGDTFVVHSDGVTEAFDAAHEMFGDERLMQHLARHPGRSAAETVTGLLDAVRRHAGGAPQSDDIAILALRVLDDHGPAR